MLKKFFALAVMLAAMLVSSATFAANIAYPADGIYSIQPKCAPDKELSVQNHASNWGANVIIDNINPNWRKWKIQRIPGTHVYSIIAVHSNLALDVANAQAANGVNVATWPFLEGKQNQFAFFDVGGGYYVIKVNLNGDFMLDVANGENRAGANVLSWSFGGGDNQKWKLVPVQRLSAFQSFNRTATQTVNAYVMPDLSSRSGNERVDRGDNVTVLREEGNAYLVRYPVSGGTKTRWVNKNEIFGPGGVTVNLNVPLLKQNNSTWANKKINTDTIGNVGCTVTSLAMKYNYHNNANITPVDVVSRLKSNNGLTGNAIVYEGVKRAFGYNNYIVDSKPSLNNAWMKKIYEQLKSGNPVIIGAYKTSKWQHWVIVKGYTGNSTTSFNAADFQINDPQNNFSNLQQFINKYSMGLRGIIY